MLVRRKVYCKHALAFPECENRERSVRPLSYGCIEERGAGLRQCRYYRLVSLSVGKPKGLVAGRAEATASARHQRCMNS